MGEGTLRAKSGAGYKNVEPYKAEERHQAGQYEWLVDVLDIGAVKVDGNRLHDLIDSDNQPAAVAFFQQRAFPPGEGAMFHSHPMSNS